MPPSTDTSKLMLQQSRARAEQYIRQTLRTIRLPYTYRDRHQLERADTDTDQTRAVDSSGIAVPGTETKQRELNLEHVAEAQHAQHKGSEEQAGSVSNFPCAGSHGNHCCLHACTCIS